jgi:hypothetical protein
MKSSRIKNISLIRNLISSSFKGDVPRKEIIALAINNGFEGKDTWPLLKPVSKGSERGTYNVDKMLDIAKNIIWGGKQVKVIKDTPAVKVLAANMPKTNAEKFTEKLTKNDSVKQINAMFDRILEEESIIDSVSQPKGKCYGYEPIAPNEDDIADELNLMGVEIA